MSAVEDMAQRAPLKRWLSIVGVGEDGPSGLTPVAQTLVRSAEVVFGGERHLSLMAPLIQGAAIAWPRPFDATYAQVLAYRGRSVCVLASGDPMHHGAGSSLSRLVSPEDVIVAPGLSAFTLAAARLLWPLQQTELVSLCGRPVRTLVRQLQPGARIIALSADHETPAAVATLLCELGFGDTQMHVLESLGGDQERVRRTSAHSFDLRDIGPLNLMALEVIAGPSARVVPLSVGLPDDLFEHDGQLTKREIRSLTLSSLAPRRGELLWDIGAGAGSISIEWMLTHPGMAAIAIEDRPDRAARIARNALALGITELEIVTAKAPEALASLLPPDAVFIGGGATEPGVIETAQTALKSGGRLVVNAVTLDCEALLLRCHASFGGSLTRVAISRADPLGAADAGVLGWRPAMPITQWAWTKP
jgi:precorrin-6B C5,15-methyltransferase / cobalt-precorrin-6B C5,C15-methyltransferase